MREMLLQWVLAPAVALVSGVAAAAPPTAAAPTSPASSASSEAPGRSGFFMRFAPKVSTIFLWSNANVLSGFQQSIPSSASATGYGLEFQIGREVWERLSLAFAVDWERYGSVRAQVADQTVSMQRFQFLLAGLGLVVTAFPFADLGWHTALKVSYCAIGPMRDDGTSLSDVDMQGPCVSAIAGYEWRMSRAWWLGVGARASYMWHKSREGEQSLHAVTPGLEVTATYY